MRILLVGDTHANTHWLTHVVFPAADLLGVAAVVQLGDFGYWPHASDFLRAARNAPVPCYFIDGNHEHHHVLAGDVAEARAREGVADRQPVPLGGNLWYLPRGARLVVDDVRIAALGGARSIDRAFRTAGVDWFLEERVTDTDLEALAAGGPCDLLVTHDAPSATPLGLAPDHALPLAWRAERPACVEHQRRIDEACAAVRPSWLVHGHYHRRATSNLRFDHGDVRVVSLAEDGTSPAEHLAVAVCTDGAVTVHPVGERP